jgi:hypothetical protein
VTILQERTTGITDTSIKKRFSTMEAWKVLSEYVWNGLDAGATKVDVIISGNQLVEGGADSIEIHDNGNGIDFQNLNKNFDNFDDSSKRDVTQKGSQGRGRYSFHKFATKATWFTRNNREDAIIEINSSNLKKYNFGPLDSDLQKARIKQNNKGTSVYLSDIPKDKGSKIPSIKCIVESLSTEFGWKLIICGNIEITVNGISVTPPKHDLLTETVEAGDSKFMLSVIRWDAQPTGEKSYNYFRDSDNVQKHRALTGFNYKNKFYISGYIYSDWFDNFQESNKDNKDMFISESKSDSSPEFKALSKRLKEISHAIYQEFLRKRANQLVEDFDSKGYFPKYKNESPEDRSIRVDHTKKLVVSICIADPSTFNNLKPKQTKILIALLDKLTVSSENDSLFDVLEGILELDKEQLDEFSSQIKRSKLDHIISTIGSLQKRDLVIQKMKYLFQEHNKEVLETPDLQGIIEANTWLFGSQYTTIGAEEDDFHKTARALRDGDPEIIDGDTIESSDLIDGAEIEGARGQVDLFLARRMSTVDHSTQEEFTRCTIIEIKRPSVALNKKHLGQVERYAEVLHKHPEFNDENMRFDVVLVGTRLAQNDYQIKKRLKDNAGKNGQGLVSGADDRIRVYVKTWASIFNDFHITHSHLLQKLKINRSKLEYKNKDELVSELQKKEDESIVAKTNL